jgi:hypothetical protein
MIATSETQNSASSTEPAESRGRVGRWQKKPSTVLYTHAKAAECGERLPPSENNQWTIDQLSGKVCTRLGSVKEGSTVFICSKSPSQDHSMCDDCWRNYMEEKQREREEAKQKKAERQQQQQQQPQQPQNQQQLSPAQHQAPRQAQQPKQQASGSIVVSEKILADLVKQLHSALDRFKISEDERRRLHEQCNKIMHERIEEAQVLLKTQNMLAREQARSKFFEDQLTFGHNMLMQHQIAAQMASPVAVSQQQQQCLQQPYQPPLQPMQPMQQQQQQRRQ